MNNNEYSKFSELPSEKRDIVSQLIDLSLELAEKIIVKEGSFNPFAVYCNSDHEFGISSSTGMKVDDNLSAITQLKLLLNDSMASRFYKACSLVYDVKISDGISKNDAICIDVKFGNVFQNRFLYPYKVLANKINYLEPEAIVVDNLF